jgi:hypothetical protein
LPIVPNHRYENALARFDAANAEDPNIEVIAGVETPRELLYARRMTACMDRLAPEASEVLRLAARSQHIRRWTIPRSAYPMDRAGYKAWRMELNRFHAEVAGDLMREAGYDAETIGRVQKLLRKEKLKVDPDAQLLEDVVCVVFLEFYFAEFASRHDEEKLISILRKTWVKMSPRGHAAALALELPEDMRKLVEKALNP